MRAPRMRPLLAGMMALSGTTAEAQGVSVTSAGLEALPTFPVLPVGEGAPLTLAGVLESVDRHHPPLEALEARVEAAEGARLAAEGGFDLMLAGRVSASTFGYYQYMRGDLSLTQPTPLWGASFFGGWRIGRGLNRDIPDYYRYDETLDGGELRLGFTVPLWRDGPIDSRRATLARAEAAVDAMSEEASARRLRIHLAAVEAYTRWVAAGRRYRVAHRLLVLAEERDQQIASRVAAGALPAIEHLENRRAILERRQALVSAGRALEQRAIALSLYLRDGQGEPRVPRHDAVPLTGFATPGDLPDEATSLGHALAARPELRRFEAQLTQARVQLEHAENQLSPRLDLTVQGSMDVGGPGVSDPDRAARFQSQYGSPQLDASLSVQLPVPLRDARGRIAQAEADLAVLEADRELAADQIRIEVRDARSAAAAARQSLELAQTSAQIARQVADAERVRFDEGLSSLMIVNLREAAAASAEASVVDAEAELALAHALYDAVTAARLR